MPKGRQVECQGPEASWESLRRCHRRPEIHPKTMLQIPRNNPTRLKKHHIFLVFTIGIQMHAILCLIITLPTVFTVLLTSPQEDFCTFDGGFLFATLSSLSLLRRLSGLQKLISCSTFFKKGFPGKDYSRTRNT